MKKLISMLAFALVMVCLTSCGGGDTPGAVAVEFTKAIAEKNLDKAVPLLAGKDGAALTEEEQSQIKAVLELGMASADKFPEIKDIKVAKEQISEDGKSADVELGATIDGKHETQQLTMLKGDDGKWRVKLM